MTLKGGHRCCISFGLSKNIWMDGPDEGQNHAKAGSPGLGETTEMEKSQYWRTHIRKFCGIHEPLMSLFAYRICSHDLIILIDDALVIK